MSEALHAPQIDNCIRWLWHTCDAGSMVQPDYSGQTRADLDRLFSMLRQLKPTGENGVREFWLHAPRGSLADYGDYEEYLEDGAVDSEEEFACARRDVLAAAAQGVPEAEGWLTDAVLRGLYGLRQNIAFGLRHLQEGLANGLPRAMALEALRLLGWIRGIPAEEQADRAWIRELLGMAASADDCLGFVALVLLEALEPASPQRQRAIAADLHKAILWAQTRADASALYLVGCVASLHLDDPGLNAVCRHYGALLSRKSGEPWCRSEYTAHLACTTFHAASLLGELSALKLTRLVHPDSGNLARLREQGTASLEDFM